MRKHNKTHDKQKGNYLHIDGTLTNVIDGSV